MRIETTQLVPAMRRAADPVAVPALEVVGAGKAFGGATALRQVDLAAYPGEVHAVLGESGAGKSTLLRILGGLIGDFDGTVRLGGVPVRFASVRAAQRAGVAIVPQSPSLVDELSVAQNIVLGREKRIGGVLVDRRAATRAARALLERMGVGLDPDRRAGSLREGERQLVAIAAALSLEPRVLLLDEPASALSPAAGGGLIRVVRERAAAGVAVVCACRRTDEIAALADRVTVLRDGRRVTSGQVAAGRQVVLPAPARRVPGLQAALTVQDLGLRVRRRHEGVREVLRDVSFSVQSGEILGIGGLRGSGRSAVLATIFGAARGERRGTVRVDGRVVAIRGPADAIRAGIALMAERRDASGLLPAASVQDNLVLPSLPGLARLGIRRPGREAALAAAGIGELGVRCDGPAQPVGQLPAGEQRKLAIGRWLATGPRILMLDEPTSGIDAGAREAIYGLIFRLAGRGMAIVVVSSELPELGLLADRTLVLSDGRVAGLLGRQEASQQAFMALATVSDQ